MGTELAAPKLAWRKYVVSIVFVALLPCAAYLFFCGIILPLFPPVLKPQLSAFLASALAILVVVLVASASFARRLAAWMAVVMLAQSLAAFRLLHLPWFGACTAAIGIVALVLCAMAMVGERKRTGQFVLPGALMATFVALLAASYLDWPEQPDPLDWPLSEVTADHRVIIDKFYRYPLAGFIDREFLWRIDATPEMLKAISSKLRMSTSETAPAQFWRMPPYYWPRSLPTGARLYSTPYFPATGHSKGIHYFMLVDAKRGRGLVWVKDNM
jgi:hypothetical protein